MMLNVTNFVIVIKHHKGVENYNDPILSPPRLGTHFGTIRS